MSEISNERLREIVEFPYDSQEQRDIARALLAARAEVARLRDLEARAARLEAALRDCRMLAVATRIRRGDPDWQHIVRFCREAGVDGSVLRTQDALAGEEADRE